ncbi:MAG TPA: 4-hydroxy-3-methylbut-2-enyl diphosphate reductase [Desulfobacteraceae bacterium]|nr:4-hydroxy-3-methylbut-2-enyl diphosphate reductase [Desulfobacteraceae bacterium]
MKITIAKTAGFCMGVRRAVDMVLDASNSRKGPICTFGPLIHNPQVLEMLEEKGIPSITAIPEHGQGTILIRAHGVPPRDEASLKRAGFHIINATCPRVIRVQTIIGKYARKGYAAVIIGDRDHPEVKGLLGYAAAGGHTAASLEAFQALPRLDRAVVVAQTTQDTRLYNEIKEWAGKHLGHYQMFDTICDSTEKRQAEVRTIAENSDAIVVIGGKKSGNTKRLAQIAKETGKPGFHIETIDELDFEQLNDAQSVAITAGASTPNWIINKTYRTIEEFLQKQKSAASPLLFPMRDFLLKTNLLLSAGAGCLTYASSRLQGLDHNIGHAFIAMLYILSMQIINNIFTIKSDRYNNPGRALFYEQKKPLLAILAAVSGAAGLFMAFQFNRVTFIVLMVMSVLGLSYNLKILPGAVTGNRIKRIKDIPGSKTLLIAAAWGIVTTILPGISGRGSVSLLLCLVFCSGLVFARTAFFDVLEMQGDKITGKETLPLLLGEKNSVKLIKILLVLLSVILVTAAGTGMVERCAFFIALVPVFMLYYIHRSEKGNIRSNARLEFIVESHFILAGFMAAIC